MKTIKENSKTAINNNRGAGNLEAIVIIGVCVVIVFFLLKFLTAGIGLGTTRNSRSTTTGWDRTEETVLESSSAEESMEEDPAGSE